MTRELKANPVTAKQRKGAIISALTLAGVALGIYLAVIMQFFVYK